VEPEAALRIARRSYEAFGNGDIAGFTATWSADVTFHAPGRSVLAGTFRGHEEALGFLQRISERTDGTFRLEVHDYLASEHHVVVLCRHRAERNGRSVDMPATHVWHTDSDGKLSEGWFLVEDQGLMDEFWA